MANHTLLRVTDVPDFDRSITPADVSVKLISYLPGSRDVSGFTRADSNLDY
jgi:hypothetical protein